MTAAPDIVVVVDNDKDKEDNGVILSGVSAIVGIVPVVVVVVVVVIVNNEEDDDGIILSGISIVINIVASQQSVAIAKPLQSRRKAIAKLSRSCRPVAAAAVSVA